VKILYNIIVKSIAKKLLYNMAMVKGVPWLWDDVVAE
jgi:hypothetical protein